MTDISRLSDTPDTSDEWLNYEPPSDFAAPPEPKEYTFMRVTDEGTWKQGIFMKDMQKVAWFNFRATIQGGEHDGRLAFGGCNTMVSKFRRGTTVQDFIFAARSGLRPTSAQLISEVEAEAPSTLERVIGPFNAMTGWEWRCRDCEVTFLQGFRKPKPPKKYIGAKPIIAVVNGQTNPEQICPMCQKKIIATLVLIRFIVPKPKKPIVLTPLQTVVQPLTQVSPPTLPPLAA